jgi:hypothetical protein
MDFCTQNNNSGTQNNNSGTQNNNSGTITAIFNTHPSSFDEYAFCL